MRFESMILIVCLVRGAGAQDATPPPKNRLVGQSGATTSEMRTPASAAAPAKKGAAETKPGGIVLSSNWSAPLPEPAGGHTLEIQDLKELLGPFGKASNSLGPQSEVAIYPGIRYLMPQAEAAKILGASGITSKHRIACGGIPDGLSYISYDGKWDGIFNRLYMVTDLANQVVSLEFVTETPHIMHSAPWLRIPANRRVLDYIGAVAKARSGDPETWMYPTGQGLVIDTVSHQTARWYVPNPMINLILYCVEKSGVK